VPQSGWIKHDLSEKYEINELDDGSHVRLWVRATDIMNHTLVDNTEVHIDNTPPVVASDHLHTNIVNGTYTHTSRYFLSYSVNLSRTTKIFMYFSYDFEVWHGLCILNHLLQFVSH
jgi:hypothetical protein